MLTNRSKIQFVVVLSHSTSYMYKLYIQYSSLQSLYRVYPIMCIKHKTCLSVCLSDIFIKETKAHTDTGLLTKLGANHLATLKFIVMCLCSLYTK